MDENHIKTTYKLANGKLIHLEVPVSVEDFLKESNRQISSQGRQGRRRQAEYIDGVTDITIVQPQEDIADLVIKMDSYRQLYAAINKLSNIQRRRVYLYYFKWLTSRQIAEYEKVSFKSVARSLERALDKLRTLLV